MSAELAAGVVAAGVLVGILSALFGVGGGILMVPFLVIVLAQGQHVAEGTSLLVIVPTAVAGVLAHRRRGFVSYRHSVILAAGGIGGAWVGAFLALRLGPSTLQLMFGLLMAIIGARVVRRGIEKMRVGHDEAHEPAGPRTAGPMP